MIDIEAKIFQAVSTLLRASFPGIYVSGEYVRTPAAFPAVSIEEKDNSVYQPAISSSLSETHGVLMYEVNVYSNKSLGKKTECKAIMATVDAELQSRGFTRLSCLPTPNMDDATIYRMTARYEAVVDLNENLFRR